MTSRSGKTNVPRPQFHFPWCSRSQSFTKNIAASNNESALKGDITNLPHVAKTVVKTTTRLWFSGNPPECDLRQHRVASPSHFSRSTYIFHAGQTNSQTLGGYLYLFCHKISIFKVKYQQDSHRKTYFADHRNFPGTCSWSLFSTWRCLRQKVV